MFLSFPTDMKMEIITKLPVNKGLQVFHFHSACFSEQICDTKCLWKKAKRSIFGNVQFLERTLNFLLISHEGEQIS